MSIEETNAFLNQLMIPQNIVSPSKQSTNPLIDEKLMELVRNSLHYGQPTLQQTLPQTIPQLPVSIQTSVQNELNGDHMLKASPSASSDMSSSPDCEMADQQMMNMHQNSHFPQTPLQQLNIDSPANIAANNEQKSCGGRFETWLECFNTTKLAEYEALLFSVYVSERAERKYDGWTYFDCLHRLQSKCRYRVRAKKQDEFYIVEEKGVHNHGAVEPVGQAGSHAGLPKTIREIVDRSYNESWPLELRTVKVDEEIKRLGLPENPRLGRQIDNRVAYLRRVKNLNETRRIQDQVNGSIDDPAMLAEAMMNTPSLMDLQALMDKNGGSLTVEKGLVEKLLGPEALAELVAKQETENQDQPGDRKDEENQSIAKPVAMNPTPDFLQFLQQQHQALGQDQDHAAIILAKAQQNLMGAQENIPHDSNQESSHFAQAHQNLLQAQQSIPQVNMQHNLMGAQENIPN